MRKLSKKSTKQTNNKMRTLDLVIVTVVIIAGIIAGFGLGLRTKTQSDSQQISSLQSQLKQVNDDYSQLSNQKDQLSAQYSQLKSSNSNSSVVPATTKAATPAPSPTYIVEHPFQPVYNPRISCHSSSDFSGGVNTTCN